VGPVWRGGTSREPELLAGCYRASLELAREHGLRSIAFPAISCGAFRYPVHQATSVAVASIADFLAADRTLEQVLLVAYESEIAGILRLVLSGRP
jgi:O-acetyl-ADP-ribose deacetylase